MSVEYPEQLSQAQEVRQSAFFMAMQAQHTINPHQRDGMSAEQVMENAEQFEEWLWRANEERGMATLILATQKLVDLIAESRQYAIPKDALEVQEAVVRRALSAVSPIPKKRRR